MTSSLADACPSLAHHPGDPDAVAPWLVTLDAGGRLWALYVCPCGREWACCWDGRAAGWPIQQAERAA